PDSPSTAGPWAPDAAYRALALKMEVVGRLAGRIAHEFNSLLTLVGSPPPLSGEFLEPGHPARETVRAVEQAMNRVAELMSRLLTFSRPAAGAAAAPPLPAAGETVLVAEREPHIRLLNQTILQKQGYRTLLAE